MNLIKSLLVNRTLIVGHRRVTPRFWLIIAFAIGIILLAVFWDKLDGIVPEQFCTSIYWKGVF